MLKLPLGFIHPQIFVLYPYQCKWVLSSEKFTLLYSLVALLPVKSKTVWTPSTAKINNNFFSFFFSLHIHNIGSKGTGRVIALTSTRWWWFSIYHSTGNDHSLQSRFQNTTWHPWPSAAARCGSQGYRFAPIWTAWQHTGKPFCRHMPHLWPKPACSRATQGARWEARGMATVTASPCFGKSKPLTLLLVSSRHQLFSKIKVSFQMVIAFFTIPKTPFHITRLGCWPRMGLTKHSTTF